MQSLTTSVASRAPSQDALPAELPCATIIAGHHQTEKRALTAEEADAVMQSAEWLEETFAETIPSKQLFQSVQDGRSHLILVKDSQGVAIVATAYRGNIWGRNDVLIVHAADARELLLLWTFSATIEGIARTLGCEVISISSNGLPPICGYYFGEEDCLCFHSLIFTIH